MLIKRGLLFWKIAYSSIDNTPAVVFEKSSHNTLILNSVYSVVYIYQYTTTWFIHTTHPVSSSIDFKVGF